MSILRASAWAHFLVNMCFLYIFGDNVEDWLGRRRYLSLFLVAAALGSLFQTLSHTTSSVPVVGASGAVAGLMGAYLILFPHVKLYVILFLVRFRLHATIYLGLWMALNLAMAVRGGGRVAWMAHIGGFVAGLLFGLRYRVRPIAGPRRRRIR